MSESYLGEIRMFGGNFAPVGWALCEGQTLSISENEILFALLGTTYGGDGQTTFKLPDLRGRAPIHVNAQYPLGALGGSETVTITDNQMPRHTHPVQAIATAGNMPSPDNLLWAATDGYSNYSDETQAKVSMNPNIISPVGGSQPHNNMMPSLPISFIISLYGYFPPQSY